MHYLKSDISELNFGKSSVLVVHKLPNFDASVFDDFFYYNISGSNATSRGGYIRFRSDFGFFDI